MVKCYVMTKENDVSSAGVLNWLGRHRLRRENGDDKEDFVCIRASPSETRDWDPTVGTSGAQP